MALGLFLAGAAISVLNVSLSTLVPLMRRGKPVPSGIPLLGSVLVIAGLSLGAPVSPWAALVLVLADTGGPMWLLISILMQGVHRD